MYICICNGLRERDVTRALAAGARTVSEVYRALDQQAQCGKCVPDIVSLRRHHSGCCGGADPLEQQPRRAVCRHPRRDPTPCPPSVVSAEGLSSQKGLSS